LERTAVDTANRLTPFIQRASALPAMPEVAQKLLRSFEPKNSSYPDAARVGGGVGKPI
jgi:hypothetical protein